MAEKQIKKQYLKTVPLHDVGFAEYNFFVETPENEVLYFETRHQAQDFINFYLEYTQKAV